MRLRGCKRLLIAAAFLLSVGSATAVIAQSSRYTLDSGSAASSGGKSQSARVRIISQNKTSGLASRRITGTRYVILPAIGSSAQSSEVQDWSKH